MEWEGNALPLSESMKWVYGEKRNEREAYRSNQKKASFYV